MTNDKIRSNFITPKHLGLLNTCHVGEAGNKLCGDSIKMSASIDSNEVVKDAKFQSFGCIYSFVCAEELAEMCIGQKCEAIKKLAAKDIEKSIGGLPNGKLHCAEMAINAMKRAIKPKLAPQQVEIPFKTSLDVRHVVAELFDDFIIPEGASKGIEIHLKDVDPLLKRISVTMNSGSAAFKSFIREILSRIDNFTIYYN